MCAEPIQQASCFAIGRGAVGACAEVAVMEQAGCHRASAGLPASVDSWAECTQLSCSGSRTS